MRPRGRTARTALAAGVVVLVGCSSVGAQGAAPTGPAPMPTAADMAPAAMGPGVPAGPTAAGPADVADAGAAPPTAVAADAGATGPPTAVAASAPSSTTTTIPPFGDAHAPPVTTAIEQRFDGAGAADWGATGWASEAAGSGEAVVGKGVGRMVVDPRGTYEWVRAVGVVGPYGDLDLEATLTPRTEALGSVYIGLRGNGNWRAATPYLPAVGVALEYAFSPGIESELRIYEISDAGGVEDRGAVPAPALRSGQTGRIRVSLEGRALRAKVWADDQPEPGGWALERTLEVTAAGSVHLAYRDEPGGTLDWDDLTVTPLH